MLSFIVALLVALLVFWLPQNAIHELSHGFVGKFYGLKMKSLKLWPHKNDKGRFYWARIIWHMTPKLKQLKLKNWRFISIAPLVSNTILVTLLSTILIFLQPLTILSAIVLALILSNLIDATFNLGVLLNASVLKYKIGTADLLKFFRICGNSHTWAKIKGGIWLTILWLIFLTASLVNFNVF